MLLRHRPGFTSRSVIQSLACRRGRYVVEKGWVGFRLVPPPNFLCLLRTPRWYYLKGLRTLRGSNHFEGMWREPPEKESRAPEWFLLGPRGYSVPPLGMRPALLAGSGRGRYPGFEQTPNLRGQGRKTSGAERLGSPGAALEAAGSGQAPAAPGHLSRARRPLRGWSLRPRPARPPPLPAPHRRQLTGARPHRTWPAAAALLLTYPFRTSPFATQPFARSGRRQQQPPGPGRMVPAAPGERKAL